jgi:hypothetical protein
MKRTNPSSVEADQPESLFDPQFDGTFRSIASTECGDPTNLRLRQERRHHGTSRSGEFIRSFVFRFT